MQLLLDFFISLVVSKRLDMHLMDMVTTYLYGPLNNDICMRIHKKCLKHMIQNLDKCIMLISKDPCMCYNNSNACGAII